MGDSTARLSQALALHAGGRLLAARLAARAMVDAAPDDPRGWHMLGLVESEVGNLVAAAAALERALARAPAHATLLHLAGRIAFDRGHISDAADCLDRAQRAAPTDAAVARSRAMVRIAAGDAAGALRLLQRIVEAAPTDPASHAALAMLRHQQGDRDGFAASYAAALAVHPGNAELWLAYLAQLSQARQPDRVLAAADTARAVVPDRALALLEAIALTDLGELARAEARLAPYPPDTDTDTDTDTDPGFALAHIRLALRQQRPHDAARIGEAAVERVGGEGAWPYLATAWRLTGDPRANWLEGDPRLVGIHDLGLDAATLAALGTALRALHHMRAEPADQSLRGGTQTDGNIIGHEAPPIVALRRAIEAAVTRHIAQLPPHDPRHPTLSRPRQAFRFAGSWSVRLTDAGYHANHIHSKGWLSSACYVALPNTPPPAGWLKLGEPPAELGLDLPAFRHIEPRPGRLVLFPSTMWHGTEPFARGERLSVAFDIVPLV